MFTRSMWPFTFLLIGQSISIFGSVLTGFALAVWAFQQSDSSAMVYVAISIANGLPIFVLGPIAGAAADRWDRKWIILASQIAAISITAILTLLYYLNVLETWHIVALVALNSCFTAFVLPTVSAIVPLMVPKGLLTRANGSIALAFGIIELVSPLLSGTLFQKFGLMIIFSIDLVTFAIGLTAVLLTTIPQAPHDTEEGKELDTETFMGSVVHGLRYLKEHPPLMFLILFFCTVAAILQTIGLMVQPMVLGFATPQQLGMVMTISGAGILFGSLALIPFHDVSRHMPVIFITSLVIALGCAFVPMTRDWMLLAGGGFILMACFPILDANCRTLFQRKVDPAMLGRVIGSRNFVLGVIQTTSILLCGLAADKLFGPAMQEGGQLAAQLGSVYGLGDGRGIAVLMTLLGVTLFVLLLIFVRIKSLRRLDDVMPDFDA